MPDAVACFTYATAEQKIVILYMTVSATEPQFVQGKHAEVMILVCFYDDKWLQ